MTVVTAILIKYFLDANKKAEARLDQLCESFKSREAILLTEAAKREELIRQDGDRREKLIRADAEKWNGMMMANFERFGDAMKEVVSRLNALTSAQAAIERSLYKMESNIPGGAADFGGKAR